MATQNSRVEVPGLNREAESTLSPTAQFVHEVMTKYVMPELRAEGLVAKANAIAREKLDENHPTVIDFLVSARDLESKITARAKEDGADERTLSVIRNYFAKLVATIKYGSPEV